MKVVFGKYRLSYSDSEDQISDCFILDFSVVLREATLTISDSTETGLTVESEIEHLVSVCTTEITEITRFKTKQTISGSEYLNIYLFHFKKKKKEKKKTPLVHT